MGAQLRCEVDREHSAVHLVLDSVMLGLGLCRISDVELCKIQGNLIG